MVTGILRTETIRRHFWLRWWTFDSYRSFLVTSTCKIFACRHIKPCCYQSKRRFVTEDGNSINAVVRNLGQPAWHSRCSDQTTECWFKVSNPGLSLRGRLLYCKLRNTVADWAQITTSFSLCPSCFFQKHKTTIEEPSILRKEGGLCRLLRAVCGRSILYISVMRDPYGSRMWQVWKWG